MPERVLTAADLSRSTLARQLLLERVRLDPVSAVERLVALQAQEPASPHLSLHARLEGFEAGALNIAFLDRSLVKGTLLRVTLHAVSARDYLQFWPAIAPSLRSWRAPILRRLHLEPPLEVLAEQAAAYAAEPRSGPEMRDHLPQLAAGVGPGGQTDAWWASRPLLPFLMAPGESAWAYGRRPMFVAAATWIEAEFAEEAAGLRHLIRRYLAGFGPAGVDDLHQFTRVKVGRLRPALEQMADELVTYRDETGRQLYDVRDGPLPAASTPAPVRFLPMWDSILLAYHDRSRVLPEPYRRRVVQVNGDFLPTFLVDGLVAGLWRADQRNGRTKVTALPFEPLPARVEKELADEATRLGAFIEPLEPEVFSRWATIWMKGGLPGAAHG